MTASPKKHLHPHFDIDAEGSVQESLLQCVLDLRRIETLHQGLRWFDIKRYGITVHHAYRDPKAYSVTHDYLKWNDPRRVIQIPTNVINAGYPATDRINGQHSTSSVLTAKPQLAK